MKYLTAIAVGLLALILISQGRILARLDTMANRPLVAAVPPLPSAAAIASEIRRQTAREARLAGPAAFTVRIAGGGHGFLENEPGRLTGATFTIVRDGGIATNVAMKSPAALAAKIEKTRCTDDTDDYTVSFNPEHGQFLPNTWAFSLTYAGGDQKPHERKFTVTYHPKTLGPGGKPPPLADCLEVMEEK
jgi:hypothetical protein